MPKFFKGCVISTVLINYLYSLPYAYDRVAQNRIWSLWEGGGVIPPYNLSSPYVVLENILIVY